MESHVVGLLILIPYVIDNIYECDPPTSFLMWNCQKVTF